MDSLYQETESDINTLYETILEFQHRLKLQQPLKTKITKKEISVEEVIKVTTENAKRAYNIK